MTPQRLQALLEYMAMSDGQVIRVLDVDPRLFRRWKVGQRDIPKDVELWLERLAQHWAENPPPLLRGRPREPWPNYPAK